MPITADKKGSKKIMNNKKIMSKVIASSLVLALGTINAVPVFAYSKDETVYTKANANGSSYQTIVSEHLKNSDNAELLKDMSTLLNIKNTNGDEEASQNGTSLEWKTSGNDIYYQGNTDRELPLDCTIKYELNGEEIAPNDLIGKSGNVKITIEYTNKEERFVNINGKSEKMYVPFVVMAGTMLDNTKMKNIEVTNGKVLDNGQKTVVVGLACPGLIESLGLEDEDLPDLNKVEISFEATDFEMGNIMSYATPKIFDDADVSAMDKLDEFYSQINDLKSASTQLVEGAKTLQDGTEEYVSKSSEFADGLEAFNQGINTATNSYNKIDEGIDSVNSNISTIKNGANKLNKGASDLSDGLNSLQTGVSAGKEQAVSSLEESSKTLSAGIDQIIAGKDQEVETIKEQVIENANSKLAEGLKTGVSSAVSSAIDSTMEKKMASVQKAILADETLTTEEKLAIQKLLSSISISDAEKQAMSKQIGTAIDSAVAQTTKAQEAGLDAINDNKKGVKAGLNTLKTQAASSIKSGISEISSGFDAITDGTTELIVGSNELKNGTSTLSQGTSKLQTGVSTLASGSKELKTGLSTLNSSSNKLNSANKQLLEGASTISDGAKTLAEGISEFDKEGINKIVSMVNGDVKDLQTRVEKLQDLANEYNSFAGKDEEAEGTTKFIFVVDNLKKDSKKEESNMPVENSENTINNEENKKTNSGK